MSTTPTNAAPEAKATRLYPAGIAVVAICPGCYAEWPVVDPYSSDHSRLAYDDLPKCAATECAFEEHDASVSQ